MCFYIDLKHPDKYVAEEDIICYKVVQKYDSSYESLWYGFIYNLGKTYRSRLDKPYLSLYEKRIEKGIHSYSTLPKAKDQVYFNRVILKCIIPKDSFYYYNSDKREYVSNRIKIVKAY